MKLYSKAHVAVISIVVALAAVAAGVAVTATVIVPRAVEKQLSKLPMPTSVQTVTPITPVQYVSPAPKQGDLTDDEQNNIAIYNKANKSIVYVTTLTTQYTWYYQPVQQEGTGSGIIIDQQGHVLTNWHVVSGADKISVILSDGSVADGTLVGKDPENDIAVLQFNPKGKSLSTISFGDSSTLQVGMKVLAIGNPFGLDRTLTTGIVSGLARPLQTDQGYMIHETIQTDAAINPGNSGGALLNSHGDLIGINTAIKSPSGASAGVGFAIPVNTARPIADEIIKYGAVKRGAIDINGIDLFPALVDYFNLPVQKGVLVNTAGASVLQAGIKAGDRSQAVRSGRQTIYGGGDIIIEINGQKVEAMTDVYSALSDTKPGQVVNIKVARGSQTRTFSVKLIESNTENQ